MTHLLKAAVLGALCFCMSPVYANAGAPVDLGWLQTIAFAAHQTNFSGTFVYQHGNRVETSRITHVFDAKGEYERMESMDGPHREVIRNGKQVWYLLDDHKAVRVAKQSDRRSFPDLLPEQVASLNENYLIREAERARVAGYDCQAIIFQPRDGLRYAHKMWVQADTGLMLKTLIQDEKGVVEQYAFTHLKVGGDIDRSWIAASNALVEADRKVSPAGPHGQVLEESSGWIMDAMPAGFKRVTEIRRSLRNGKQPALHLVFSDGLAGVSVFVEAKRPDDSRTLGLTSHGAINIYTRLMDDFCITVVGEVPARTVVQIAESVRYAGK